MRSLKIACDIIMDDQPRLCMHSLGGAKLVCMQGKPISCFAETVVISCFAETVAESFPLLYLWLNHEGQMSNLFVVLFLSL